MAKKIPNMIEAGLITPQSWSKQLVRQEVAFLLAVKSEEIEKIDFWDKQIWVKIIGIGAKFLSYRRLSLWHQQGLAAISNSSDVVAFENLGRILRQEFTRHREQYPANVLEEWRQAWQTKLPSFQTNNARVELRLAREQEARNWLKKCQNILNSSQDIDDLERNFWEIESEFEDYDDFPYVIHIIRKFWEQKFKELGKPGDFWTQFS